MSKPRVIRDFNKLVPEVLEQVKLAYPNGFAKYLISFPIKKGKRQQALPFEADDFYYLIKMTTAEAEAIVYADEDYINGKLSSRSKKRLEDKYTKGAVQAEGKVDTANASTNS